MASALLRERRRTRSLSSRGSAERKQNPRIEENARNVERDGSDETDRGRPRQVRHQAALRPDPEIFKFTAKFCSLLVFVLRVAGEMPRNTRSTGAAWSVGPAAALFRE
jgi:hypothetical protein